MLATLHRRHRFTEEAPERVCIDAGSEAALQAPFPVSRQDDAPGGAPARKGVRAARVGGSTQTGDKRLTSLCSVLWIPERDRHCPAFELVDATLSEFVGCTALEL